MPTRDKDALKPNLRAPSYFLVESKMECLACGHLATVYAIGLPTGYEIVRGSGKTERWAAVKSPILLYTVTWMSASAANYIRTITSCYRLEERSGYGTFWMNHCDNCDEEMLEEEMYMEPEWGPFGDAPYEGDVIRPKYVDEPIEIHSNNMERAPKFLKKAERALRRKPKDAPPDDFDPPF